MFYTGAAKDDDFVVGRITLKADDFNATGIMDVRSKTEEGRSDVYDLQGRKVSPLNKGLYIVNGRKVVLP